MIRCTPSDEPATFNKKCRLRGTAWLAKHPDADRPMDYWREFEPDLRNAFNGLCAYCAMKIMQGQVDHFRPWAVLKDENNKELAYEWDNFRYGEGLLNRKKWKHLVLDPFDVQDDWFKIQLPDLQLLMTDNIPADFRELAEFTLKKLRLQDGEVVVRFRLELFEMYREGKLLVEGLRELAPQIADAVERDLKDGTDWRR